MGSRTLYRRTSSMATRRTAAACDMGWPSSSRGRNEVPDSLAVVFPGQGSQFAGMADPWTSHPAGKAVIEEASEALGRDLVAGCRDEALLETTEFTQPALLACDVAAFRVLEAEGVGGWVGAAGHSLGEFAALVAAGVFSFENGLE